MYLSYTVWTEVVGVFKIKNFAMAHFVCAGGWSNKGKWSSPHAIRIMARN